MRPRTFAEPEHAQLANFFTLFERDDIDALRLLFSGLLNLVAAGRDDPRAEAWLNAQRLPPAHPDVHTEVEEFLALPAHEPAMSAVATMVLVMSQGNNRPGASVLEHLRFVLDELDEGGVYDDDGEREGLPVPPFPPRRR